MPTGMETCAGRQKLQRWGDVCKSHKTSQWSRCIVTLCQKLSSQNTCFGKLHCIGPYIYHARPKQRVVRPPRHWNHMRQCVPFLSRCEWRLQLRVDGLHLTWWEEAKEPCGKRLDMYLFFIYCFFLFVSSYLLYLLAWMSNHESAAVSPVVVIFLEQSNSNGSVELSHPNCFRGGFSLSNDNLLLVDGNIHLREQFPLFL